LTCSAHYALAAAYGSAFGRDARSLEPVRFDPGALTVEIDAKANHQSEQNGKLPQSVVSRAPLLEWKKQRQHQKTLA
jgi:hypothetical protein